MKNGVNVLLIWLSIIVHSPQAHSADDPVIEAYAHANIEETQQIQEKDYRLVLGKVDVVNNLVRIRHEKRLDVTGTSYLYRVTPGYSSQDAYNDIMSKLKSRGANIVFNCSGRDCGDSNSWANSIFGKAELYGKEREQNYVVAEMTEQGKQLFLIAFTIKRGNGRVYLYTEELYPKGESSQNNHASASANIEFLSLSFEDESELISKIGQLSLNDLSRLRQDKTENSISFIWMGVRMHKAGMSHKQSFEASISLLKKIKPVIASKSLNAEINLMPLGSFYADPDLGNEFRIYVE